MLSQTSEYGLRAIAFLADHAQTPMTSQQIADGVHVPAGYLSKVLQQLGRAGLVKSQRGLHGGFVLDQPASAITMLDVVNAIEPFERITSCPLKISQHTTLCPLHRQLDAAIAAAQAKLSETTIQQLLDEPSASHPLCEKHEPGTAKATLTIKKSRK